MPDARVAIQAAARPDSVASTSAPPAEAPVRPAPWHSAALAAAAVVLVVGTALALRRRLAHR